MVLFRARPGIQARAGPVVELSTAVRGVGSAGIIGDLFIVNDEEQVLTMQWATK